ncbi:MAG: hypothetical protein GX447_06100 [Elusimicrobia bacterium]|nr:hypothetical protein [Elusimicrobiota bacterium]
MQNNFFISAPEPIISADTSNDFYFGYFSLKNKYTKLPGPNVNMSFSKKKSSDTYTTSSFGTALFGFPEKGFTKIYLEKKRTVGTTFYGQSSVRKYYGQGNFKNFFLSFSIPVSFGKFEIGNTNKDNLSFYNILLGVSESAGYATQKKSFLLQMSSNIKVISGYNEKYEGGEYYSNMKSGVINPFFAAKIETAAQYIPNSLNLIVFYESYFASSENDKMEMLSANISFKF